MTTRTIAEQLWNNLYFVGLQNKFIYTEEHMKRLPGLSTDDPDINREFRNTITVVPRTAIAMIMLYDKGIEPVFQNRKDMLTIYNNIVTHLNRWAEIVQNPLDGRKPPPANDLLMMENFTHYLYEEAAFERLTQEAAGKVVTKNNFFEDLFSQFRGNQVGGFSSGPLQGANPINPPEPIRAEQVGSNISEAWDTSPWSLLNGNS